jgi:hypothetical protein
MWNTTFVYRSQTSPMTKLIENLKCFQWTNNNNNNNNTKCPDGLLIAKQELITQAHVEDNLY